MAKAKKKGRSPVKPPIRRGGRGAPPGNSPGSAAPHVPIPQPNHTFGRTRPSQSGRFPIHTPSERDVSFRPLPKPTGNSPFRLDLKSIISPADYQAIVAARKLTFHLNGDMGGIKQGMDQQLVAKGMEQDFDAAAAASDNPAFLYITGDCVYYNGEITEYYSQFYQPYEFYPRPIFAVAGNHDGENLSTGSTLDGFMRNFCQASPVKMPESQDSNRTAMTQPNVYWTLLTPLVNIVGLYSNVPSGGEIIAPQVDWLTNELKTLPTDVPLFVALHHPVYSADDHHGGSTQMKHVLETAATAANRHPDMVIAGHVHNYQRFTKITSDGSQAPYLVTGAGGYFNLHNVMKVNNQSMITPVIFNDAEGDPVTLERYCDDHHGFMNLQITDTLITGRYYAVPRMHDPYSKGNKLIEYFEYDWKHKKYVPNALPTPAADSGPAATSVKGQKVSGS
jgi:predicted phosphodiesterase